MKLKKTFSGKAGAAVKDTKDAAPKLESLVVENNVSRLLIFALPTMNSLS